MKRFIMVLCCIILAVGMPVHVKGLEQPNCASEGTDEWRRIWQGDPRWGNNTATKEGGFTVGEAGCLMCSVIMLMAYDNPELRDWDVFNPYILTTPTPKMDMTYTYAGSEEYNLPGDSAFRWKEDKAPAANAGEQIKGYMDEGYYVILHVPGHYVAVTGWNEELKIPIIQDSGGPGIAGDLRSMGAEYNWNRYSGIIEEVRLYTGMRKANEALIGYATDFSSGTINNKEPQKVSDGVYEYQGSFIFLEETDLPGMTDREKYMLVHEQEFVKMVKKADLSIQQQQNLVSLGLQIQERKTSGQDVIKWVAVGIGFILCSYGILLMAALMIDRLLGMLTVQLTEIFTFGLYRYEEDSDLHYTGLRREAQGMTFKALLQRYIVLLAIGLGLITGFIQQVVVWIYTVIF